MRRIAAIGLASIAVGSGCTCAHPVDSGSPGTGGAAASTKTNNVLGDPLRPTVLDITRDLESCAFGHHGVLLDFGDGSMQSQPRPGRLTRGDDEVVEHGGATWLRVRSRALAASFYWPPGLDEAPDASAYVEARVSGVAARAMAVAIDAKPIGSISLTKGEARIAVSRASTPVTLAPGGHELTLRFLGGVRAGEALAEIDWVHVGTGEAAGAYAAPTRGDVLLDATVGGQSLRAISLRAPGFVRCSTWIPANATLETSLAAVGGGDADVEARLLRDRREPRVLGRTRVVASAMSWMPWSIPVTGLEGDGGLASIELAVQRARGETHVLFGAPQIMAGPLRLASAPPPARSVVVVVLGSTSAKSLAPWGGPRTVKELARLASSGTTFMAHRASSTLATAVVGSLLTGLPPHLLNLDDASARLPRAPTTIAEACRQAGIATAMFTANPTTGSAFGFDRGWSSFVAHDPLEDAEATRVFDEASAWIGAHEGERFLVVVHARGGHPPWDVTPDELKGMPPPGYVGILDPHRAAEALARARKHGGRFKDEDRTRAWALYDRVVELHDVALGRLLATVRPAGHLDDTMVVVTGDVAVGEASPVPFVDADALDEPLLATPLVIRWPRADALAGRRVEAPTSPEDLAPTILGALGLSPPHGLYGIDLVRLAQGEPATLERPLTATSGAHFAVRWGPFVLVGAGDHETRMCDLSLDPTCLADVRATSALALEALHRRATEALTAPPLFPREGAVLDPRTEAALVRWGRLTDDRTAEDGL